MNYQPQIVDMLLNIQQGPIKPSQGWQCPVCKSVYAPWYYKCDACEQKKPNSAAEQ